MARESSSTKYTKDKAFSATKASAKHETKNEFPTQSNTHELPTAGKTPSPAKSKHSKTASAPAVPWNTAADPPEATKPASKTPSKPASKTASQKAKEAPGSYPASESSHHTTTIKGASSHHSANNAEESASKKSASKKSNKDADAAAGGEAAEAQAAAGGQENWDTQAQDATAWQNGPTGDDAAWGGAAGASGSFKW